MSSDDAWPFGAALIEDKGAGKQVWRHWDVGGGYTENERD